MCFFQPYLVLWSCIRKFQRLLVLVCLVLLNNLDFVIAVLIKGGGDGNTKGNTVLCLALSCLCVCHLSCRATNLVELHMLLKKFVMIRRLKAEVVLYRTVLYYTLLGLRWLAD